MITLKQFLESVHVFAESVDVQEWNEEKWEYDVQMEFSGFPDSKFILEGCEGLEDYIVTDIESSDMLGGDTYLRIGIQSNSRED